MRSLAVVVIAVVACSSNEPRETRVAGSPRALSIVRATPLGARLHATAAGNVLATTIPSSPTEPMRIERDARTFVAMTARDVESRPARAEDGAYVYEDVALDEDLVRFANGGLAEELRVLRTPRAARTFRWSLATGPAVSNARAVGSRIELVDEHGAALLRTEPIVAIDARGVHRDLAVTVAAHADRYDVTATLATDSLEYPIVVDPAWLPGNAMSTPRGAHALVGLPSGKAIAIGGSSTSHYASTRLSTTELYDPASGTWSAGPAMTTGRSNFGHAWVGTKLLVFGGTNGTSAISSTELYDPTTNTWAAGPSMSDARWAAAWALLTADKLLVSGGLGAAGSSLSSAEVYDAVTSTWRSARSMVQPRAGHALAIVPGSTLYLASGGFNGTVFSAFATKTTEVYDTSLDTWTAAGSMTTARMFHGALGTSNHVVLGGGGTNEDLTMEVYSRSTDSWGNGPALPNRRHATGAIEGTSLLLIGGDAGGTVLASVTRVTATGTPTAMPALATARSYAGAASGLDVIVAGGGTLVAGDVGWSNALSSVEVFANRAMGRTCMSPSECASGNCVNGFCCSVSSCAFPTVCGASGTCGSANGATCITGGACASGKCVDGYCCESACTGSCEACDVAGSYGKCVPVTDGPHGGRLACYGVGACAQVCDGVTRATCTWPGSTKTCSAATCTGAMLTSAGTCDGMGTCKTTTTGCAPYACDGTSACKTTCAADTDCTSGYCMGGACLDKKVTGTACTAARECQSGFCADGYCCESACGEVCGACDMPGQLGKCVAIKGEPRAARTVKCPTDPANKCASRLCDGTDRLQCLDYVGSDVVCLEASCKDGQVSNAATCNGKGACSTPVTSSCGVFACDPVTKACKTSCATSAECLAGYQCSGGACVSVGATCSADSAFVETVDGKREPCTPFKCKAGACLVSCGVSDDCQAPALCDNGRCVPPAPSVDEDSGSCAYSRPSGPSSMTGLILAVAAFARRRKMPGRARSVR